MNTLITDTTTGVCAQTFRWAQRENERMKRKQRETESERERDAWHTGV